MNDYHNGDNLGLGQPEPAAPAATPEPVVVGQQEPMARYCPGCGHVGPVESKYHDCCPDGGEARMIPQSLAEKCHATFKIAIRAMLADAGDDSGQAQDAQEKALPTIKGAYITGGYVVVIPAGWGDDKGPAVRDAILRLFPVNPAHTPKPDASRRAAGGEQS